MARANEALVHAIGHVLPRDRELTIDQKVDLLRLYLIEVDPQVAYRQQVREAEKEHNRRCQEQGTMDLFRGSFKWHQNGDGKTEDYSMPIGSMSDAQFASCVDERTKGINRDKAVRRKMIDWRKGSHGDGWLAFMKVPLD